MEHVAKGAVETTEGAGKFSGQFIYIAHSDALSVLLFPFVVSYSLQIQARYVLIYRSLSLLFRRCSQGLRGTCGQGSKGGDGGGRQVYMCFVLPCPLCVNRTLMHCPSSSFLSLCLFPCNYNPGEKANAVGTRSTEALKSAGEFCGLLLACCLSQR